MCAHPYVPIVQTKAPSQTPINRLARLVRNKGLKENADFTGQEGAEGVSTFGVYLRVHVRGLSKASAAVERHDPSP